MTTAINIELKFLGDDLSLPNTLVVAYRDTNEVPLVEWEDAPVIKFNKVELTEPIKSSLAVRAYQELNLARIFANQSANAGEAIEGSFQLDEESINQLQQAEAPIDPNAELVAKVAEANQLAQQRMAEDAARLAANNAVLEFDNEVNTLLNGFSTINKIYIDKLIAEHNIDGIIITPCYKNNGIAGIELQFSKNDLGLDSTALLNKMGEAIQYYYDLGVPLLCKVHNSIKPIVMNLTRDHTNGEYPPVIDGPIHFFSYTENTLARAIKFKEYCITVDRRILDSNGFLYKGKLLAADNASLNDINSITNYLSVNGELPPGLTQWKAIDNTYATIESAADWTALITSMVLTGQVNFATSQMRKAALANVTEFADLDDIDSIFYVPA